MRNNRFLKKRGITEFNPKKDFYKKNRLDKINYSIQNKTNFDSVQIVEHLKSVNLPITNMHSHVLTVKSNSIVNLLPKSVDFLFLVASRIDEKSINRIANIEEKYLIISDVIEAKKGQVFKKCLEAFKEVKSTKNHAKIMIFSTGDNFYFAESSANPSVNARSEHIKITNSKDVFTKIKSICFEILRQV